MSDSSINISLGSLLDKVKPLHLGLLFVMAASVSILVSIAVLYHFNKYRNYSPVTILAEIIYVLGIVLLFVIALVYLVLFSI